MTGLRFASSEGPAPKCPRRTILNALEGARILPSERSHDLTRVSGDRILEAACARTIAIATHHTEGRFDDVIREAEAFLPPIVGPTRGRYGVLLLDIDAMLDADPDTLLSKTAAMAVLREACQITGRSMAAAHLGSYLRQAVHAIQLKEAIETATTI